MTSTEEQDKAIEKIQQLVTKLEEESLTEEETVTLRKMVDLWNAFAVLGKLANTARNVIIWLSFMVAAWWSFSGYIKTWLGISH